MNILERAHEIADELVAWRRAIHARPEPGFREVETAALIAATLEPLGYRLRTQVGRTGIVAERGAGSPIIAIRADMDALPIQEANNVPYASQVPGMMHACGHDAHVAAALGAARLLAEEALPGTVRFLFQPSEESEDEEGVSGAPRMIADGAMEGVDAVVALHVEGNLATGDIAVRAGPAGAGVDTFYAAVIGRGGHGARPHEGIDPIHIAGYVILALHAIPARRLDPTAPAVVSIGTLHGGQTDNVIPDRVELSGTIRYMDPALQPLLHVEIERALSLARTMGGDYELAIRKGYPPLVHDEQVVRAIRQAAADLLGQAHVHTAQMTMGAEDFSFLCARAPGAMFRLGCRIEGDERSLHSPRFDLDERCLPIGAATLAHTALRLMTAGQKKEP